MDETSRRVRGRREMSAKAETLRRLVVRSVAAEEMKAQALGVRVREAAFSKSCVEMSEARGGFVWGLDAEDCEVDAIVEEIGGVSMRKRRRDWCW